jgi:ribosomal protection tetracycline resistance protein
MDGERGGSSSPRFGDQQAATDWLRTRNSVDRRALGCIMTAAGVDQRREHDEHDDALLADLVEDVTPSPARLWAALRAQTAAAMVYPLVFGCALSGAGVATLLDGIGRLLPPAPAPEDKLRGRVFAIEGGSRGRDSAGGDKVAYIRSYGGQLQTRQRVTVYRRESDGRIGTFGGQVSALHVVGGSDEVVHSLTAGHIAQVRGLPEIRIGDQIGSPDGLAGQAYFARPSLETVVRARRAGDAAALHAALVSLADQDPLISTRVGADGQSSVLLYGEVQKEVIAATLADVYGLDAVFMPTQIVHLERPVTAGTGYEHIGHVFAATIGLRVAPAATGSGVRYRRSEPWRPTPARSPAGKVVGLGQPGFDLVVNIVDGGQLHHMMPQARSSLRGYPYISTHL